MHSEFPEGRAAERPDDDRTVEAIVVDGDLIASDREPGAMRHRLRELCKASVSIIVTAGEDPVAIEELVRLSRDPSSVLLVTADCEELQRVTPSGTEILWRRPGQGGGDAIDQVMDELHGLGVGPGLVMLVGVGAEERAGARAGMERAVHVPVADSETLSELLDRQLARRAGARVPSIDPDPRWTVVFRMNDGPMNQQIPVIESLGSVANGTFGARGTREGDSESRPMLFAAGVYDDEDEPLLLEGPMWTSLVVRGEPRVETQTLDLRSGVLLRECDFGGPELRTFRFLSLARPEAAMLRAEGPASVVQRGSDLLPGRSPHVDSGGDGTRTWERSEGHRGSGITAAARTLEHHSGALRVVDRLAAYLADPFVAPHERDALAALSDLEEVGFDRLLADHRAAWARRWNDAEVSIEGDPEIELAIRFALFHLIAAVSGLGESAVGARGMSGPAYGGHVLWDADVYVLPVLAAVHPEAARAMVEYRVRRLDAARDHAKSRGYEGARFPWESGRDGLDVTPNLVRASGHIIPILTGEHEEHIVADVAWAANHYAEWTGDWGLIHGSARPLITDTARYWASRVRTDHLGAHIYGVVGPDEYREIVDDNAFTNVMARWNLRAAARLADQDNGAGTRDEVASWRAVADALLDGYQPETGRYEQCAGFWRLEPVIISDMYELPMMADEILGREVVRWAQIVKQPDVLMLHHMVPEEVAPGSLGPNLDFYLPRTAHGSSLSPAIHAGLLARAGRPDEGLELLRLACRLDLDDITGCTARGLHLATMGGVWQALVFGFLGMRPRGDALTVDPRLPSNWRSVTATVRFQGGRVRLIARDDEIEVLCTQPTRLVLGEDVSLVAEAPSTRFVRGADGWRRL